VSPATVGRRRHGEKLLQATTEANSPSSPPTIRMIPTVLMLNPDASTSTAKVRIAPTTNKKMLNPILWLAGRYAPEDGADRTRLTRTSTA
jgi:hypothetical protein